MVYSALCCFVESQAFRREYNNIVGMESFHVHIYSMESVEPVLINQQKETGFSTCLELKSYVVSSANP